MGVSNTVCVVTVRLVAQSKRYSMHSSTLGHERRRRVHGGACHPPDAAIGWHRGRKQCGERTTEGKTVIRAEEDPGPAEHGRSARTYEKCMPVEAQQKRQQLLEVIARAPIRRENRHAVPVLDLCELRRFIAAVFGLAPLPCVLAEGCRRLIEEEHVQQSDARGCDECDRRESSQRLGRAWWHRPSAPGDGHRREEGGVRRADAGEGENFHHQ